MLTNQELMNINGGWIMVKLTNNRFLTNIFNAIKGLLFFL